MTEIVEVLFIKNSQCGQTGWEYYPAGTKAHFYADQAAFLVDQGWAVFRNPQPIAESSLPPAPLPQPKPDFSGLTVKELKATMHAAGIPFTAKMRKADLIKALEDK
jgi:hypothetical protein